MFVWLERSQHANDCVLQILEPLTEETLGHAHELIAGETIIYQILAITCALSNP